MHASLSDLARCAALLALAVAPGGRLAAQDRQVGARIDVCEATILDLQEAMREGLVTSVDLVEAYVARIRAYDQFGPQLNAVLHLNPRARPQAASMDEERRRTGPRGPLHGIPVLLKDNFDIVDLPVAAASPALLGLRPPDDSYVVRKLREAGAVVLGTTNMSELAFGITTVSSVDGQTRNPYALTRNPGGSSGGTAVAVATSMATIGYGTDTCGSIRIPAAFNSLFGLRPTKGLVSVDGIIPLSRSQDVAGPLARTVTDLAIGLDAVAGYDPADPATAILEGRSPPSFVQALAPDALAGARIGVLTRYLGPVFYLEEMQSLLAASDAAPGSPEEGIALLAAAQAKSLEDKEIAEVVRGALDRLRALGADLVEVDIPALDSLLDGSSVTDHEFKFDLRAYLAKTPGAPVDSLGDILERGLYHPSIEPMLRRRNDPGSPGTEAYGVALRRRAEVRDTLLAVMRRERLDALAYPTMRRPPAPLGLAQFGTTCEISSSSGLPSVTMPAGFSADGLPIGFELLGGPLDDAELVGFAYAYEQGANPRRAPPTTPPLRDG
jgi:Asp-tRNA(Asn)/Glu-tRNA(Gln) amidotransferase A subunit family amidase